MFQALARKLFNECMDEFKTIWDMCCHFNTFLYTIIKNMFQALARKLFNECIWDHFWPPSSQVPKHTFFLWYQSILDFPLILENPSISLILVLIFHQNLYLTIDLFISLNNTFNHKWILEVLLKLSGSMN